MQQMLINIFSLFILRIKLYTYPMYTYMLLYSPWEKFKYGFLYAGPTLLN